MEITTTYTSPSTLTVARHRVAPSADSWMAYGLEAARVLAPVCTAVQGTSVSAAMRDLTSIATTKAIALLPTSDVAVTNGFGGLAGIRTRHHWSPPV